MQHELPSARLPHHSGDDAAGGLPSLGSSPKMEPKVVGRTSAEVEAAAASLHLEAYGEEEPEEMWEQMSPRVYRNLDEIFAGEYEGMRCADGAILAQSCAQFSDPPSVHTQVRRHQAPAQGRGRAAGDGQDRSMPREIQPTEYCHSLAAL